MAGSPAAARRPSIK